MNDVLSNVKTFLSTVESEQFVNRKVREEVDSFVHSLGEMGKRSDEVWESRHLLHCVYVCVCCVCMPYP